jgi:hypothetical protein
MSKKVIKKSLNIRLFRELRLNINQYGIYTLLDTVAAFSYIGMGMTKGYN